MPKHKYNVLLKGNDNFFWGFKYKEKQQQKLKGRHKPRGKHKSA